MTKVTKLSWDDERTATLTSIVGDTQPVTQETVAKAAESLDVSTRSISSKLRNMGVEVETIAAKGKGYTEAEEAELITFLEANANNFTYAEIAAQVLGGSRNAKQIQGKLLSMELYGLVKATPKPEATKTYSDAEEATILELVTSGAFIEDIASAVSREVASVRGKILSMSRTNDSIVIPKQRTYKDAKADAFSSLGNVSEMTVEAIALAADMTQRGVKTLLTRRAINCSDHKGADRAAKNAVKNAA